MATHVQILLSDERRDQRESFNREAHDALGAVAKRGSFERLAVCLVEGEAVGLAPSGVKSAAAFDAVIDARSQDAASVQHALGAARELGAVRAYRVEERRIKTCPRSWPDGEPSPGLFMISTVFRAPGISADAFDTHWLERHAPLALRHHPGMWDYRQEIVRGVLSAGAPPFDGLAWMGFPSARAFREGLFDSPEGRRAIMADTERFLDLRRAESAILRETVLASEAD